MKNKPPRSIEVISEDNSSKKIKKFEFPKGDFGFLHWGARPIGPEMLSILSIHTDSKISNVPCVKYCLIPLAYSEYVHYVRSLVQYTVYICDDVDIGEHILIVAVNSSNEVLFSTASRLTKLNSIIPIPLQTTRSK